MDINAALQYCPEDHILGSHKRMIEDQKNKSMQKHEADIQDIQVEGHSADDPERDRECRCDASISSGSGVKA